jgi:hypothetical protein
MNVFLNMLYFHVVVQVVPKDAEDARPPGAVSWLEALPGA